MNLIQLRISFANAWRSWNSSGKTFPCCERLPWVMPAGWHTRKDQLWSSRNKAVNPTSKQTAAASWSWGAKSKMDPTAAQKKRLLGSTSRGQQKTGTFLDQGTKPQRIFLVHSLPLCHFKQLWNNAGVWCNTSPHSSHVWRQSLS